MKRPPFRILAFLIGIPLLLCLLAGVLIYYSLKLSFESTEFYPATGIERVDVKTMQYVVREGNVVFAITSGKEGHSLLTGNHGSIKRLSIECPQPVAGQRIEVGGLNTRLSLHAVFEIRTVWEFGDEGVYGYLQIEDVSERRITASYYIIVDGFCYSRSPDFQHEEIVFQGRDVFRRQPRPEGNRFGFLWPRTTPK